MQNNPDAFPPPRGIIFGNISQIRCQPMRRVLTAVVCFCLCLVGASTPRANAAASPKSLQIYFIDVEGGQATLVVSPSGESLLIDTGWPGYEGRDADRILAAAHQAGLKQID